jgi:sensor histidine kinase YesM
MTQAAPELSDTPKKSPYYLPAQLAFWGGYFLLNLVFMALWKYNSWFNIVLFALLSLLLGIMSHGLGLLYKSVARNWSLLRTSLNLLWVLPVAATFTQLLLTGILLLLIKLHPALASDARPVDTASLAGYTINYAIMLGLWSLLYLLRAEFYKRRNSEIAYWRLQAQLKDNELQFLRSQINSHFLFNAINNLRALIKEDPERARAGLSDLSTLLRGLLQSDGQQLISLQTELDWVRGYLGLEALQFETRLQVEFYIDESLLSAQLPPLLLQTLVENAIKHGIAARRQGGTLRIDIARLSGNRWQLRVTNPPPEFEASHQGNKIGLRNARERLQLAFGNRAQLNLNMGEEITATVEMPL